jgi:competence protein CoiA
MAHRLLKTATAAAARDAGWTVELEVAGDGWRADVLATSPDGQQRLAWEPQLAAITPDDVQRRHETMTRAGLTVCWVSDLDRPWTRAVPSILVRAGEVAPDQPPTPAGRALTIVGGAASFRAGWCSPRRFCDAHPFTGRRCVGHGHWTAPDALLLDRFVAAVSDGTVRAHRPLVPVTEGRKGERAWVWTTQLHLQRECEQAAAVQSEALAEQQRAQEAQQRAARAERHRACQQALAEPARQLVGRLTHTQAWIAREARAAARANTRPGRKQVETARQQMLELAAQRQQLLLALYDRGLSIRELAGALEVSPAVIAAAIRTA